MVWSREGGLLLLAFSLTAVHSHGSKETEGWSKRTENSRTYNWLETTLQLCKSFCYVFSLRL